MMTESSDTDFWEFVGCAKCHLPYASGAGKSVPFWLTECGHIICNHHLNPDQSCSSCGSTGILLVPLQQELDAPMSEWFKSIPAALDAVAYAAKFQHEALARQIRFFRSRHQQTRAVMEKLRSDNFELKRANEMLAQENERLKHQLGYQEIGSEGGQEPLSTPNQNGKRSMGTSTFKYNNPSNQPRTDSSSLRESTTPTMFTIPVGQCTKELTHSNDNTRYANSAQPSVQSTHHPPNQVNTRPMSQRIGQFAYIPPGTPHVPPLTLSHAQMAPKAIRSSQNNQSRQKENLRVGVRMQTIQHQNTTMQQPSNQQIQLGNMGPPPMPQARLGTPAAPSGGSRQLATSSRRFIPRQDPLPQPQPSTSHAHGPQRFFPRVGQNSSSRPESATPNSGESFGTDYG